MSQTHTQHTPAVPDNPAAGPLAGKRVAHQPNWSVRGHLCSAGCRALEGYRALEDATLIARLQTAGAVLADPAAMAELGFGLHGDTTVQPVAQGAADLALVNDTLGECRVAAAAHGLFGFKPSYGRVSRHGLIGLVPSMECPGIIARTAAPILATLAAVAGPDPADAAMPDDCRENPFDATPSNTDPLQSAGVIVQSLASLDGTARRAFEAALARLAAAGVAVQEIDLPDYPLFRDTHQVIAAVEASSSAGKFDGVRYGHRAPTAKHWNEMYLETRKSAFGPLLKALLFQGAYLQFDNYAAFEQAARLRRRLVDALAGHLKKVDLLVMPTRNPTTDAATATTIAAIYDAFAFTLPANLAGLPALHLPGPQAADTQDPGLQLIGRRLDDTRLLALGVRMADFEKEGR